MLKKVVFTIIIIISSYYCTAQKDINNYKYIIVPKTFDFFKSEDKYQLNSLTKFLFNKYGYEAYFDDDNFPDDLKKNGCLALTSEVVEVKKNMFRTKLEIKLKDCFGTIIKSSQVGESLEKEFKKSYTEALRGAFETFQNLNYKYTPNKGVEEVVAVASIAQLDNSIVDAALNTELIEGTDPVLKQLTYEVYYAQSINDGFQLVNSEPKIVMILWTTAAENVFLVKGKSAIVFKEDGFWYYSENDGKLEEKQQLNIKF